MALQTNLKLETGVEIKYIKVSKNISFDYDNKQAICTILGFKDEEAKLTGLKPVISQSITIKNEKVNVITKRPMTISEIKQTIPLINQIKFVKVPVYRTETRQDEARVSPINPTGDYLVTTDEVIDEENLQVNLTDEELLELGKGLTTDVTTIENINYFDDFIVFLNKGKYLEGIYNYLKINPEYKNILGETSDI